MTYVDTGVTPNVIHVVYDTSQAGGQGIETFDTSGNPIATPNGVILYHELSHAFHFALGQVPFPQTACPGNTTDEPAAEIDENVMRTELGLCQRDVCNHNGQIGWGATCGGRGTPDGPPLPDGSSGSGGGGGGGGGCFIVTAAVGTATTFEVLRLRAVRDRLAARIGVGSRLIGAIYQEYLQFSPAIAVQIAPESRGPTSGASVDCRAAVRVVQFGRTLDAWALDARPSSSRRPKPCSPPARQARRGWWPR